MKKQNFVYNVVTNYFFWIFLALLFLPYICNLLIHLMNNRLMTLEFWDYITSCYWFIFQPLAYLGFNPSHVYYGTYSIFSYMQLFIGILGVSQLASLSLSILNFPKNKNIACMISLLIFIPSLLLSIIPIMFVIGS